MSVIWQVIFDFRFLALFAVAGSLAGSLLCFLNVSILKLTCILYIHLYLFFLDMIEEIGDALLTLLLFPRVVFILLMHIKSTGQAVRKEFIRERWYCD